jgi:oxygen-dependent protoporphyrinogen oxidase
MERLVEALRADMEELEVITEFPVSRLEKSTSWKIHGKSGPCLEADAICLALPAFEAARLLEGIDRVLAAELNAISYESAVTVNLAYRNIPNVKGFGYVVPPREKRPLLGCTFTSQKFEGRAPEGTTLIRAFLGGPSLREVMRESDADILERIQAELRFTLGIKTGPILARVTRLPRAMPQYHVGHAVRVAAIRRLAASHAGLFLAGNAYEGVGIPDCIRVGEEQAVHLLRFLEGLSSPRDTRVRVGS